MNGLPDTTLNRLEDIGSPPIHSRAWAESLAEKVTNFVSSVFEAIRNFFCFTHTGSSTDLGMQSVTYTSPRARADELAEELSKVYRGDISFDPAKIQEQITELKDLQRARTAVQWIWDGAVGSKAGMVIEEHEQREKLKTVRGQLNELASGIENSTVQVQSTWFSRKIEVRKGREWQDQTLEIEVALEEIKNNLQHLDERDCKYAMTIVTKLNESYKKSNQVSWLDSMGKTAKYIEEQLQEQQLRNGIDKNCGILSSSHDEIQRMTKILGDMATSKKPTDLLKLKKQAISLVCNLREDSKILNRSAFIEEVWKRITDELCIQDNPFFKKLAKGPQVLLEDRGKEACEAYKTLAEIRNKTGTPDDEIILDNTFKMRLPGDFEDSIKRNIAPQIKNMATFYDQLHQTVRDKYPQIEIKTLLKELESYEQNFDERADTVRSSLGEIFLKDLRAKLGAERECLLEPILLSVEQACPNAIVAVIEKKLNSKDSHLSLSTPMRRAVEIKIPKGPKLPVEAIITCDFPRTIMDSATEKQSSRKFIPTEMQGILTMTFDVSKTVPWDITFISAVNGEGNSSSLSHILETSNLSRVLTDSQSSEGEGSVETLNWGDLEVSVSNESQAPLDLSKSEIVEKPFGDLAVQGNEGNDFPVAFEGLAESREVSIVGFFETGDEATAKLAEYCTKFSVVVREMKTPVNESQCLVKEVLEDDFIQV